ncbi:GIY-YIG nuclease family protein [Ekhidna sp.]|uniref:GIY-YIG nuclease family protein n=1 Tax=Ekhidna sp. TaxID=2608089 RepID=UPI0035122997
MRYFIYALYSSTYNKIYIGRTSNIKARLMSHYYTGTKGYTLRYRPWKLVYLERCEDLKTSMVREKQLKSAQGRAFVWNIIKKSFS